MELLVLITVLIVIVAIAKVMRSHELSTQLANDEEYVSLSEIKTQGFLYALFGVLLFGGLIAQMAGWGKFLLPVSASEHGDKIDNLFWVTMYLILFVFFLTHTFLFAFIFKYYKKKDQKALWFPHNNKLEMVWTIIPAIVLLSLVFYGLSTWDSLINAEEDKDAVEVELVGEQFKWTAHYSGKDNQLGKVNFSTITSSNSLGIVTTATLDSALAGTVASIAQLEGQVKELDSLVENGWSGKSEELSEAETQLSAWKANERRLKKMIAEKGNYSVAEDDVIIRDTLYLCKGRTHHFTFRSKDIIHSAYFPHFRAQMNCVPGMSTEFTFKPRYTAEEMKVEAAKEGKTFYSYELVCNKICGASHYKMRFPIVVLEQKDFDAKMKAAKTFGDEIAGN
ncbi:MAG: cytochrome c oxidase subunit II [Flavobacteriales bacterium]